MINFRKRDYQIAIKRLSYLAEVARVNNKSQARRKYELYVEGLRDNAKFCFKNQMGLELKEEDVLDISFKDHILKDVNINIVNLTRFVRSGYQWGLFSEDFETEKEFKNEFGCTREELTNQYWDFEMRFYKSDKHNLIKRN